MRFRRHQEAAQASTRRLIALFLLVLAALVLAVNAALAAVYRFSLPFADGYPHLFFETNTAIVLLFVLGGCWLESLRLREGGAHVARMAGGRPALASGHTPAERLERRLHNIVQEMALASRVAPPAAWVLPREDSINAFAAGWSHDDAVIAVTRGALERLTREELQGVVAHEFSHVVHGDTRLNMRLVGLVWGLQMVFLLGRLLSQPDEIGRRPATTLFGWALIVTGWMGWAAGRLLQAAVSRQREFLADASAVQYTRLVQGLGGALRKIAHQARFHTDRLHAPQTPSLAHLFLSAPGTWRLWSTHPPLAERLRRLYGREMEPLPADPLPAPAGDEPLMRLAPRPGGDAPQAAPLPVGSIAGRAHDPTHDPAWHGDAAREQQALTRIALWYGAGQCQAALLVWLAGGHDSAMPGVPARLMQAAHSELVVLSPLSRLDTMAMLTRRLRNTAPAQLASLRRAARQVARGADGRLRRLLVGAWLRHGAAVPFRSRGADLEALGDEVAAATMLLGGAMDLPPATAAAWRDASLVACGLALRAPKSTSPVHAAMGLQRLAPMQRPRLVRAWVDALPQGTLDARRTEMLQIACRLLDTPDPPALQHRAPGTATA